MRAFEIGLEFSKAEWPGGQARFTAGLEELDAASGAQAMARLPSGVIYVNETEFQLPTGLKMVWRILP